MRACPLCLNWGRELLLVHTLTNGASQSVWSCQCGMTYAESDAPEIDYSAKSIYAAPSATGSGTHRADAIRLGDIACTIERMGIPKTAAILDYGCAQGGLLDALCIQRYTNLTGFDLSPFCMESTAARGHKLLAPAGDEEFDLIILSHVLEHVPDPQWLLRDSMGRLKWDGSIYVETPDALRYSIPFLDFNSEHINHFDSCSLKRLLESVGLFGGTVQEKSFALRNGSPYPAIWTLTRRSRTAIHLAKFIEQSQQKLALAWEKLRAELANEPEVILWGAGEYLAHLLPLFTFIPIAQIIDSNVKGRLGNGLMVQNPQEIFSECPIVITAIVAAPAIHKQIEEMGLPNRIIELELQ